MAKVKVVTKIMEQVQRVPRIKGRLIQTTTISLNNQATTPATTSTNIGSDEKITELLRPVLKPISNGLLGFIPHYKRTTED